MSEKQQQSTLDQQLEQQQIAQETRVNHLVTIIAVLALVFLGAAAFVVLNSEDATAPVNVESIDTDSAPEDISGIRNQVQQAILEFEQQYQSLLSNEQVVAFAPELTQQTQYTFESALHAFARSDFISAQQQLQTSTHLAQQLSQQWMLAVDSWFEQAESALSQQRPQEAQLYLDRMRSLNDQDERISTLQLQINQFDSEQALQRAYDTAVVERNLQKQVELLEQLVALQGQDSTAAQKLEVAQQTLRLQRISAVTEQAHVALQQYDFGGAQNAINQLKQLQANTQTITVLEQQLRKQQRQLTTERTRELVLDASEKQQWQTVLTLAQKFLQEAPGDSTITDLKVRAEQVLSAHRTLNTFALRPERLSDSGIRARAEQAITQAQPLKQFSSALSTVIDSLKSEIDYYTRPVAVTLVSDESTQVHIIGVEQYGAFATKQVSLLPGSYTIEGRRAGYVTVKKNVQVTGDTPITFSIACTTRI
ncbi:hypothetical protein AAEU32_15405 [Pseudoalteromonas sp. SSDWG2]|uniref:hypothetical protein n=1 Tax=Pseudoalteromonas sp. SSDWG2 TaxID=3139391 RepID=UPI003BAC8073